MSKPVRKGPVRLAAKLKQIRKCLNVSQSEMVKTLGAEDTINRTHIANFERGEREPTLLVLLKYAKTSNVYLEVLVDDSLNLPTELPSKEKSLGIKDVK